MTPVPAGLERYEISELCCDTHHAAVFRGRLREEAVRVLVKIAKAPRQRDQDARWLIHEYKIARALQASCAAKVFAIEQTEVGPTLVYVDEGACPLEDIAGDAPLEVGAVLAIGSTLAGAVAELHQEHLVHANLNLTSVWRCPETGALRIADFGCARTPNEPDADNSSDLVDVRYIAPEQTGRVHQPIDQRADIYAIGVILYRLLTGRVPFDWADPLRVFDAHLTATPAFPAAVAQTLPHVLIEIVLKCLAKNPDDRYFSATGLKADLHECVSEWQSRGAITDFPLGRHDAGSNLHIPPKLYGRERETDVLRDFVRKMRHGRPSALFIKGSPGVGKTAFLNQLSVFVQKENGLFGFGKFDQYKRNVPYFSLIQVFQQLVHQLLSEPAEMLAAWKARILTATENTAQVVIDVIPEIELITGRQPPIPSLPPTEARNRFTRILTNFIQAFARPDQPLCMFMDDLHWVDSASLEILGHVLTHPDTKGLLFVGAYRDNEVGPDHPLEGVMSDLAKARLELLILHLNELKMEDVLPLVQETLSLPRDEALPLTQVLHSRSQGNALYFIQLLHFLHETELIHFDFANARWQWDLQRIQSEAVTESILDLLGMRIRALPAGAQHILSTAACVGSTFEAAQVAVAADCHDIENELTLCVRADLVVALRANPGDTLPSAETSSRTQRFSFLHDRIQQAAFDLVPENDKKSFRLQIGRRLLARVAPEDKDIPQVDVLSNLNYAWELITAEKEREELARLNLIAGRKARDALAYGESLRYISVGLNLLNESSWESCYDLAFELHANALECEYLTGSFARAEELFTVLLERSRSKLDKAKIYLTKILLDTSEERYENAIDIGTHALRLFGIRYVREPGVLHLAREAGLARLRMQGRRPRDLAHMRPLKDKEALAALKILVALFPTAYFLSPNLLLFTGLKVVNYSLRHGISPLSATGFVLAGLGLGAVLNRPRDGYEFGQFAVELAENGEDEAVLCKVLVIFSEFIKFWCDPVDASFPLIERARKLALKVGDHQYVDYAIIGGISLRFSRGVNLNELIRHCEQHEAFVLQSKDAFPTESFLMWKGSILALMGKTESSQSLSCPAYDEAAAESRYRRTGNLTLLSYQYTLRLQLAYLFGHYEDAFRISTLAEAVITSAPGYITVVDHYLYRGLAAAALLNTDRPMRRRLEKALHQCVGRLKFFADTCPQNFLPHATLLNAEVARLSGECGTALKLYNKAIELAEERGFTQLVALANERAALCSFADEQRRLGSWYIDCARISYSEWGALAKVAALDRNFGAAFTTAPPTRRTVAADLPSDRVARHESNFFDVAAAAAASQVIAGENEKDRVLINLMQIIRMQAGAEAAHLFVPSGGGYRVEASAVAETRGPGCDENVGQECLFSRSILNYVAHTLKDLVVDEPHLDARFARCDYLARYQPRSVMCAAIVKQTELLGVIYLEHRKITRAFDQQKLAWLRILATEVGLTVWTDKLSRYREYLHRFAPTAASKQIDADPHNPDLSVQVHDVSILFADLAGYTVISEVMQQAQLDHIMNRAFSEFIDDIHRHHGVLLRVHGDEMFVLFQDEDPTRHARNAANAALSISHTASRLNEYRLADPIPLVVNMGINTGPAAVGLQLIEATTGAAWRYDATGSTVNIAARVREIARGGDILLSGAAADRIKGEFKFEELGEYLLKNVSSPIRLYRMIGPATA